MLMIAKFPPFSLVVEGVTIVIIISVNDVFYDTQ